MTALVVASEPTSLVAVHEQCDALEAWAARCESVAELADASNRLHAIDDYLARTSIEGRARVAAAMRRLEVRIGVLLGPSGQHRNQHTPPVTTVTSDELNKKQVAEFRQMAEHADTVEDVIAGSDDERPPSRRKVMSAIKARTAPAPASKAGIVVTRGNPPAVSLRKALDSLDAMRVMFRSLDVAALPDDAPAEAWVGEIDETLKSLRGLRGDLRRRFGIE